VEADLVQELAKVQEVRQVVNPFLQGSHCPVKVSKVDSLALLNTFHQAPLALFKADHLTHKAQTILNKVLALILKAPTARQASKKRETISPTNSALQVVLAAVDSAVDSVKELAKDQVNKEVHLFLRFLVRDRVDFWAVLLRTSHPARSQAVKARIPNKAPTHNKLPILNKVPAPTHKVPNQASRLLSAMTNSVLLADLAAALEEVLLEEVLTHRSRFQVNLSQANLKDLSKAKEPPQPPLVIYHLTQIKVARPNKVALPTISLPTINLLTANLNLANLNLVNLNPVNTLLVPAVKVSTSLTLKSVNMAEVLEPVLARMAQLPLLKAHPEHRPIAH